MQNGRWNFQSGRYTSMLQAARSFEIRKGGRSVLDRGILLPRRGMDTSAVEREPPGRFRTRRRPSTEPKVKAIGFKEVGGFADSKARGPLSGIGDIKAAPMGCHEGVKAEPPYTACLRPKLSGAPRAPQGAARNRAKERESSLAEKCSADPILGLPSLYHSGGGGRRLAKASRNGGSFDASGVPRGAIDHAEHGDSAQGRKISTRAAGSCCATEPTSMRLKPNWSRLTEGAYGSAHGATWAGSRAVASDKGRMGQATGKTWNRKRGRPRQGEGDLRRRRRRFDDCQPAAGASD